MNGASYRRKIALSAFIALAGAGFSTQAHAGGDLGGNCCADLEERVAELEATTARKGNRVVSLQVYGQVNRAIMHWDDGIESDTYVVDNANSTSRFGLVGSAKIRPGWTAGYKFEAEFDSANSSNVTQSDDDDNGINGALDLRHAHWWIESDSLGRLTVGQQYMATGQAAEQDLSGTGVVNNPAVGDFGGGLQFRTAGGSLNSSIGAVSNEYDFSRQDAVRYDSPTFEGFSLSAAWGEDDMNDVALYYSRKHRDFKIAAAVGWGEQNDDVTNTFEQWAGSLSVLHVPSGLNITVAGGERDTETATTDESYIYVKGGLHRKWYSVGATSLAVSYYNGDGINTADTDGEFEQLGFHFVQNIDAAAMQLYTTYTHNEYSTATQSFEDIDIFAAGARIKF